MKNKNNTLTPKQEKACLEYVKAGNKSAAYRAAFDCSKMKDATVNRNAHAFFEKNKIAARVEELQSKLAKKLEINAEKVLEEIARNAFSDISNFFDENGKLLPIKDIPDMARRAISAVSVKKKFNGEYDDDGNEIFDDIVEIRTNDKTRNLELLGKHLGLFKDSIPVQEQIEGGLTPEIRTKLDEIYSDGRKRSGGDND
jgi:phage terminase small subunit